ncbi:hypothetical protein F5X68DRAFT_250293 [Plectosphaerella plurivora]|uniref:Heterokaryon incompatibility domain-containing protein n=1 Tax=Plectosphaerella plurivora TaxID=936078 RepID=A0A9P9A6E4_9PEZI|nr:hypothetical protein F5X68DRAFT_250293 [Plectosphaerella plurivora]
MNTRSDEPISAVVERVWGKPEYEQRYTRAYFNWVHLLYMVDPRQGRFEKAKYDEFMSALSEPQRYSLTILVEWWDGPIQEAKLSSDFRDGIMTTAMAPLLGAADLESLGTQSAAERERVERSVKEQTLLFDPSLGESTYHDTLFLLWTLEFCYSLSTQYFDLAFTRQWAAVMACNQRIAWSAFSDVLKGTNSLTLSCSQPSRKLLPPTRATLAICPWLSSGFGSDGADTGQADDLPYYLWDVKGQRTVEVSTLLAEGADLRYLAISHTWGRWKLASEPAASIDGVPWRVPLNSRFDVQDLKLQMSDRSFFQTPYAWIDLFCIPQDTSDPKLLRIKDREIARQGQIFGNANGAVIWLNEVTQWKGLELGVLWLLATFMKRSRKGSKQSNGLVGACLDFLEAESQKESSELFEEYEYTGRNSTKTATPSGWFSSLWTLQEACLRPDMPLVDRNFRYFAVGVNNQIVTLDNLLAIINCFELHEEATKTVEITVESVEDFSASMLLDTSVPEDKRRNLMRLSDPLPSEEAFVLPDMPRSAAELHSVLYRYEMPQLLQATPLSILALANQRYCKHSRAQAIMSVLGAKTWYLRHLEKENQAPPEDELVLGTFPLAFVREVQRQLGADFFRSVASGHEYCPKTVFERTGDPPSISVKPVGSMLPFSSSAERPKRHSPNSFQDSATGHPSVLTWTILPGGDVQITQAAIFCCFMPDKPDRRLTPASLLHLQARVLVHFCDRRTVAQDVILEDFLREYSPEYGIYAVLLSHGWFSRHFSGVILQDVAKPQGYAKQFVTDCFSGLRGYEQGTRVLVRVGTWTLWDVEKVSDDSVPGVRDVDWRVL